jgi:subtilisin family serine protease
MKLPMIVLKEEDVASGWKPEHASEIQLVGVKAGAKSAGKPPQRQKLSIEVRGIDDPRDLNEEKGVLAAAPPMPMMLIKSMATGGGPGAPPQDTGWGITAVNAAQSKLTGAGITVAILDTGIDPKHPAFHGVELVRRNFITQESDDDTDGHGTHCAGTIFGRDVDGHRIGIARGVTRALIGKVIGADGASTDNIVKAINWAISEGAQVISMSLGMDFAGYQEYLIEQYKLPDKQATSMALAGYRDNIRLFDKISTTTSSKTTIYNSAIVTAAAGNESDRPNYSITVAPPAAAELFLPVTAVGLGDNGQPPYQIAKFSNDGGMFAAPGVDIWSAKLGGGLFADSGTSMAAPHVAGVAALWAEKLVAGGKKFDAATVIESMIAGSLKLAPGIAVEDARYGMIQAP